MSVPADTRTAVEVDQLQPLARPALHVVPEHNGVVVDLRAAPEQLAIEIREETIERPFLASHEGLLGASQWERGVKRSIDVVGAVVAITVLSPLLVCAALMVKVSSRGPVFYAQDRAGWRGRPFRFLKFRSMCRDAHEKRHELDGQNEVDGPVFKIRDDPRITRVGRVLRKFSLDELPQLVHVLSGKMSLVGPRPLPTEEAAACDPWEAQRLLAKPGITCVWQVSGRSDLDFHTWVRMDIEYIRDWSVWVDLKLLARTVPAVLSGHGAY